MAHLIDKDALVAEIEKRIKHYNESAKEFGDEGYNDNVLMEQCKAKACEHILSFIDTFEGKEVEYKEIEERANQRFPAEAMCDYGAHYDGYVLGATEQKQIDIDKACEWIINHNGDDAVVAEFCRAMKE